MRKVLLALITTWILAVTVAPTIIITHSTPKFFQLSKDKMAIVIDEDENQVAKTLVQAAQQEPTQTANYYTQRTTTSSQALRSQTSSTTTKQIA
jgi:ferric iron reductase protein FhuF